MLITQHREYDVQVNHEEVNHIDNTTSSQNNVQVYQEEATQAKTQNKGKTKVKTKTTTWYRHKMKQSRDERVGRH